MREGVRLLLAKLIQGQQREIWIQDQQALASWSVVTVLLLQHTHNRAAQLVIPASDYAGVYETKSPTALMKVFTGYLEPPGRGSRVEASAEYLAEDRSMADSSRLPGADDLPPPLDMRAYTATLRLGFWVAHVERPHLVVSVSGIPP